MLSVRLSHQVDFEGWRHHARRLALAGVAPDQVLWSVEEAVDLFAETAEPDDAHRAAGFSVPRALVELAETAVQARDPARFALLYTLVWRIHRGERRLLEDLADPAVQLVQRLAQSVRRDLHKMRAFVRFREVVEPEGTRHVAWFEPEHYIVEANAPFFVRRFATMAWTILTPYRSAHWDGDTLRLGPGARREEVPTDDALEAYWRAYFASIFNPARLKISAMLSEMPRKYWRNLPETAAISGLIQSARSRTEAMIDTPLLSPPRSPPRSAANTGATPAVGIARLADEAASCRRCQLWEPATQTVFGEGPEDARLFLLGEQPGDQEDLAGHPFVGPAGQLLDRALIEAGIERAKIYITNAVKHFKFEPRGKRRIHATPNAQEIEICRFWLDQELALLKPPVLVLLGASAARAVLGRSVTISRERGRPIASGSGQTLVTVHPSYLLRLPDEAAKRREYAAFVADLTQARKIAYGG